MPDPYESSGARLAKKGGVVGGYRTSDGVRWLLSHLINIYLSTKKVALFGRLEESEMQQNGASFYSISSSRTTYLLRGETLQIGNGKFHSSRRVGSSHVCGNYLLSTGTHIWPSTDGVPGHECRDTVRKFASRSCRFVLCCGTRLCETLKTLAYRTAVPLGLALGAVNPAGLAGVIKPNGLQPTECRNRAREPPIFGPSEHSVFCLSSRLQPSEQRRMGRAGMVRRPHRVEFTPSPGFN